MVGMTYVFPLAEGKDFVQPDVVVEPGKGQLTLQVGRYLSEIY
jgi:hypothetical protein